MANNESLVSEPAAAAPKVRYGWLSIVLAIVFGVIYADVLWNAIGDLVNLPGVFGTLTPWWLLILDVVVPVAVYAVAFLLGRRRTVAVRAVLFLIGFGVVACSTIGSIAYIQSHYGVI